MHTIYWEKERPWKHSSYEPDVGDISLHLPCLSKPIQASHTLAKSLRDCGQQRQYMKDVRGSLCVVPCRLCGEGKRWCDGTGSMAAVSFNVSCSWPQLLSKWELILQGGRPPWVRALSHGLNVKPYPARWHWLKGHTVFLPSFSSLSLM